MSVVNGRKGMRTENVCKYVAVICRWAVMQEEREWLLASRTYQPGGLTPF